MSAATALAPLNRATRRTRFQLAPSKPGPHTRGEDESTAWTHGHPPLPSPRHHSRRRGRRRHYRPSAWAGGESPLELRNKFGCAVRSLGKNISVVVLTPSLWSSRTWTRIRGIFMWLGEVGLLPLNKKWRDRFTLVAFFCKTLTKFFLKKLGRNSCHRWNRYCCLLTPN